MLNKCGSRLTIYTLWYSIYQSALLGVDAAEQFRHLRKHGLVCGGFASQRATKMKADDRIAIKWEQHLEGRRQKVPFVFVLVLSDNRIAQRPARDHTANRAWHNRQIGNVAHKQLNAA